MRDENFNGGSGCRTFVVKNTILEQYNGNDEYVRLPGFVFVVGSGSFKDNQTIKEVIFPSTTKRICALAFSSCVNLERVELPYDLTEIGDFAFSNCTSLREIVFNGMKERWLEIKKGERWFEGTGEFVISCKNGIITKQEEIESDPKTDSEISAMLATLKSEGKAARIRLKEIEDKKESERQEYLNEIMQNQVEADIEDDEEEESEEELRYKALKFFIEKGRATTTMAQTEFNISYMKARDLIEWMKSMGYVKPLGGYSFTPCKVIISREDFKKIFGDMDCETEETEAINEVKEEGRGKDTVDACSLLEKLQHIEAAKCVARTLALIVEKKRKEKITADKKPSHSLWNDEEEFEREVLLRIRKIILSNFKMARRGAIKLSETYLEAVHDTHDGRVMQVYETVVYELKKLSDKSYLAIRKYLQDGRRYGG